MNKICGYNSILCVSQETFHVSICRLLKRGKHLILGASFAGLNRKIDHGNIGGGASHCHTSELSIEFRENLANSLRSPSGGRDKVRHSRTPSSPVLTSLRGTIHDKLCGRACMNSSHESFNNAKIFVNDLC